jgi:uncharacterized heparinase superfamily protein
LLRLIRTVTPLRWEQWLYRPVRRIQSRLPARMSAQAGAPAPERFMALAAAVRRWDAADYGAGTSAADAVLRGEFRFLNESGALPEGDWTHRHVSHLWSYNLHYFDYAVDLARAFRETREPGYCDGFAQLATSWIQACPAGRGDGWEPYAVSLRVTNWIHAILLFGDALNGPVRERIETSLATQAEYLSRRLEVHILANHLQKNLKTLVVAGLYFSGPSPTRWLEKGTRLLWRELFEQVLPDGTHFERSPMYHAIAARDFLEVVALLRAAGEPVPPEATDRIAAMLTAQGVLSRPDGSLHLFNDAAQGIAPSRAELDRLGQQILGQPVPAPEPLLALPDGGYYGYVNAGIGERLLIDCGDPGPSYQPGHAHCDLLSFELDLGGRRFAVDAGVHGYDDDPYREYVRSTRAHNTVVIAGRDQHEMWGTFRVARRGRVLHAGHEGDRERYRFAGAYSPYHDRRSEHERTLVRQAGAWRITDRVHRAAGARLDSYLHLHPDWDVAREDNRWVARAHGMTVEVAAFGVDRVQVRRGEMDPVQGWHCPEFGKGLPASVLEMTVDRNDEREFGYEITVHRDNMEVPRSGDKRRATSSVYTHLTEISSSAQPDRESIQESDVAKIEIPHC